MTAQPIACSLTSPALRARQAETAEIARQALRSRRAIDGGELLVFSPGAETEAALRTVIEAETECCPFLTLNLRRPGGQLELEITGPDGAGPIIAGLFA